MSSPDVHRLAAFTEDPAGGNPAGVVLADGPLEPAWMQAVAADVGYSETAFLWRADDGGWHTRYFSPQAEVPFCGHATIAAGVLLGEVEGPGPRSLHTVVGDVPIEVVQADGGATTTLTSVEPWSEELDPALLDAVLSTFGWTRQHLCADIEPALGFAGARHVLLPARSRAVLSSMAYDFDALREVMLEHDLTTVAALWRRDERTWQARNAFPVGGVVEDPATGAAAAAAGGWLRDTGQVTAPVDLVIEQGEDIGRPSRLDVHVPATGGIRVTGRAVHIP